MGRDCHLDHQRVRTELRSLGLKMMLGHEIKIVAELVSQHPLAGLVNQDTLVAGVHIIEVASGDQHARGCIGDRQVRGAVLKDTKLDHECVPFSEDGVTSCMMNLFESESPRPYNSIYS